MAKKNNNTIWIILAVLLVGFFIGGQQGWFNSMLQTGFTSTSYSSYQNPSNVVEYNQYQASIFFSPNTICLGSPSTGSIDTNIPNGECTIFYNDGSWKPWKSVSLNANGDYQEAQIPNPDVYFQDYRSGNANWLPHSAI